MKLGHKRVLSLKRITRRLTMGFLALVMMLSCVCVGVFAFSGTCTYDVKSSSDKTAIKGAFVKDSDSKTVVYITADNAAKTQIFSVSANGAKIQFDATAYATLDANEQKAVMSKFVDTFTSAGVTEDTAQGLYDKLSKESSVKNMDSVLLTMVFRDTKADLATAMKWFSPFNGLIGIALGIAVIILIILLILSTVLDLAYISFPNFRDSRDSSGGSSGKPPMGISRDAWDLTRSFEGNGGGGAGTSQGSQNNGSIHVAYLKKRVITYVVIGLCILYLISGSLAGLIGGVLDLVSGIV